MPLSLWMSLFAVCVMGAISPGPSLALVLRHTLGGGRIPGIVAALAHSLGVGFYALLTVLGLGALMARFPLLFQAVTWAGAAYLAWLGIKALRSGGAAVLEAASEATTRRQAACEAILVALGNPKLILFFVALLSQFLTSDMSLFAKVVIVLTAMLTDGAWYVLVAVSLTHSRVLPWLQARAHWVHRIIGVMLLMLALRVVIGFP